MVSSKHFSPLPLHSKHFIQRAAFIYSYKPLYYAFYVTFIHIHTIDALESIFGLVSVRGYLACRLVQPGIEPPTSQLVNDLLILNYSPPPEYSWTGIMALFFHHHGKWLYNKHLRIQGVNQPVDLSVFNWCLFINT